MLVLVHQPHTFSLADRCQKHSITYHNSVTFTVMVVRTINLTNVPHPHKWSAK